MNDDLISKQELLNNLDELDQQELYLPCHFKEFVIEEVPSVQPKTGHWIASEDYDGDVYYTCSVCEEPWVTIEGTPQENRMRYCPHCGAKMGGDADEQ
ncbi:MAG: hypothetical protein II453_17875 [Alphaproteobacteria bacterium]|nr:hypothetical protein [Alphaproteobacteria bacterium]MBQ3944651.1 hypothetical protein [Alphaproteobacteria bacterium]